MTLVSLLTPCWNGEPFLTEYFRTILRQTQDEIELVFVNDGSTDATESICHAHAAALAQRGYRFVYLTQENRGAAAAIDHALKHATGDYIMLLDVDDLLMPQAVSAKADFLDNNPQYGLVRNNGYYLNVERPKAGLRKFVESEREKHKEDIFEDLLLGRTNNWPGSYMVRKRVLFSQIPSRSLYRTQYGQNLQILLPVAYVSGAGFIDIPLMWYVTRPGSHSHPKTSSAERVCEFSRGYEDIRLGILDLLELPTDERACYRRMVQVQFHRNRMLNAEAHRRRDLFEVEYFALREAGASSMTDAVRYALIRTPLRVCVSVLLTTMRTGRSALIRLPSIFRQQISPFDVIAV